MDDRVEVLAEALEKCREVPVWSLSGQAAVDALDLLQAHAGWVDAMRLELIRTVDASGIPADQGAANTAAWLADRYRLRPVRRASRWGWRGRWRGTARRPRTRWPRAG